MTTKKTIFGLFLASALGCFFFGCAGREERDLLLVTIDTLRADALGTYGHPEIDTPNLDRLARDSIIFMQVIPPMPMTSPSHATMLTGLYPRTHGVESNSSRLDERFATLPAILRERNYSTMAVISGLPLTRELSRLDRGFQKYDEIISPTTSERVTECALDWLAKQDERPVFVWAHYYDPHRQYIPPHPFNALRYSDSDKATNASLSKKADKFLSAKQEKKKPAFLDLPKKESNAEMLSNYYGEVAYTDRSVGRLLREWENLRTGSPLIVVTADHGESLGEHGYFFNHTKYLYEASNAVPLILHGFGEEPNSIIEKQARLIDLFPTILDALGIEKPDSLPGETLPPVKRQDITEERIAFIQCGSFDSVSEPPGKSLFFDLPDATLPQLERVPIRYGVRFDSWKYIDTVDAGRELYDLKTDPGELRNLAETNPEEREKLAGLTSDWLKRFPQFVGAAERNDIDEETRMKLRALGYIN